MTALELQLYIKNTNKSFENKISRDNASSILKKKKKTVINHEIRKLSSKKLYNKYLNFSRSINNKNLSR